jgi:hypothetical protein
VVDHAPVIACASIWCEVLLQNPVPAVMHSGAQ